jgi:hypothetical protein
MDPGRRSGLGGTYPAPTKPRAQLHFQAVAEHAIPFEAHGDVPRGRRCAVQRAEASVSVGVRRVALPQWTCKLKGITAERRFPYPCKGSGAPCRRAGMRSSQELVGADDPQIGRVLFCLQDRRLPLAGQVLEALSVEQRLVELAALEVAHLAERRVGDDLTHAAAQRGARHGWSLGLTDTSMGLSSANLGDAEAPFPGLDRRDLDLFGDISTTAPLRALWLAARR